MMPHSLNGAHSDASCQLSWEDGERLFCRVRRLGDDDNRGAVPFVLPAGEHPSSSGLDRLAHEYGLRHELAAYRCNHLNTNLLATGDPLDEVQGEAERGLAFAQKMRFGLVIDAITGHLGHVRTLRGLTSTFRWFDDEGFDEHRFERRVANNAALAVAEARYFWGADGKVRQLDQLNLRLSQDQCAPAPVGTIEAPAEHLDLATVIKVSQAISGDIVLENLFDALLRTALAQAGAERGLLVLAQGDEPRIAAEATTLGDTVAVHMSDKPVATAALLESVIHYVLRIGESIILDDATAQRPFAADPYIRQHQVRSVLCLPLVNQGQLIGVLYLENKLTPGVFAPARIAVLKLLASQAAIALENTRLYRDLAEREGKIRRLVDSNIIGIFVWDFEGHILEANEAFLHMVGYDREELIAGRISWEDLTPPDWRDRCTRWIQEQKMTGTLQPIEKEYFRKGGSRVPVLIGAATFKEGGNEGVAFVLDLTERKRAEQRLRELESDLAHVNRVSIMGELAASLAHEITQPIASARNNARAALNFLNKESPDLSEVREALGCVVGDADRAGDIIDRVCDHVKKAPPRKDHFDLNEAINEVVVLARNAIIKNGVSVQTRLSEGWFPVQGDRVQLQQVVLNLILNAVEAMGSVEVGARELLISAEQKQKDGVLVAVRDSGPGIDPEHLERVFEAFYTTKPSGVGMGLSICRSIIDAHGGRLWAEANEPRGVVFQFALPSAQVVMNSLRQAHQNGEPHGGTV
jgi:PAS domain S-box-containing protein